MRERQRITEREGKEEEVGRKRAKILRIQENGVALGGREEGD